MEPKLQPLLDWVVTQIEAPVRDETGRLSEHVDPDTLAGEPTAEQGTLVCNVSRAALPMIGERVVEALRKHRLVVLVAERADLRPHELAEKLLKLGVTIEGISRPGDQWAMLVSSSQSTPRSLLVEQIAEVDALFERVRETEATVVELTRDLAEAIDVQRTLISQLDESALRAAQIDNELRRYRKLPSVVDELRNELEEQQKARAELDELKARLEEELRGLRADVGEIPRLRNELEKLRAENSALRSRRAALEERQRKLLKDREKLRHRLSVANWKLRRLKARRWWTLGTLLSSLVRRPLALGDHAYLLRMLLRPPAQEPRPQISSVGVSEGRGTKPPASDRVDTFGHVEVKPVELRRVNSPAELVVASILDEMSSASFAPECRLVTFTPSNWRAVLERNRPDLLFVESAWKGPDGAWEYQVGTYSHPQSVGLPHLTELVGWCRERGIPTVFWNKEDPVHFEKFKEAAQLFDVVFTTDADCVPRYRALRGLRAHTVAPLPFAAQPRLHYPAPLAGRIPAPAFAGTFYRNRHPERQKQLEMLLDGALPFGLRIYDRMNGKVTESFGYPDRFQSAIVGGVPYAEMVDLYRQHRVFLNTNSVQDSPTMFSRRVFELLACGTPVVSTPSRGMEEIFGDEVTVVDNQDEVAAALGRLLSDDEYWSQISVRGLLAVARAHLYEDRLRAIAEAAGYRFANHPQANVIGSRDSSAEQHKEHRDVDAEYIVFGVDDRLAWVGRIVDADVIGYAQDAEAAYTWADTVPAGDVAVRRSLYQEGWEPAKPLPEGSRAFLIPK